jgi:hypothetical protein
MEEISEREWSVRREKVRDVKKWRKEKRSVNCVTSLSATWLNI